MTLPGIDVSGSYQTPAQTTGEVTAGRARFVIVKASEGSRTAGARHDELVAAARAAGALVGHYHYAWANQDPQAEAHNFLTRADAQPGDLLVLDLEEAKDGVSWARRLSYALDWLHTVRAATGADPVIYLNPTWAHGLLSAATASQRVQLTSYPLWIAAPSDPAGKPRDVGWPVWTLHQFSIAGGVDRNVLNGDADTWRALAVPAKTVHEDSTPTPAPAPAPLPLPTTGDPMVRSFTVPVVFTGGDTATADITYSGFKGTPEVLVTPGTPNYKAASYARTATRATIAVKCDWPSTSTVFCSVLVVGERA